MTQVQIGNTGMREKERGGSTQVIYATETQVTGKKKVAGNTQVIQVTWNE